MGNPGELDDATAERLLRGEVDPSDAPPGYEHLAALIQQARQPASFQERMTLPALPYARPVVPAGARTPTPVAAASGARALPTRRRRRYLVPVGAAVVIALGATAAAAATGNLGPVQGLASRVADRVGLDVPADSGSGNDGGLVADPTAESRPSESGSVGPPESGSVGPPESGSVGPPESGSVGPPESGSVGPPESGSVGPPESVPVGPPESGSVGPPDSVPVGPPTSVPVGPPDSLPAGSTPVLPPGVDVVVVRGQCVAFAVGGGQERGLLERLYRAATGNPDAEVVDEASARAAVAALCEAVGTPLPPGQEKTPPGQHKQEPETTGPPSEEAGG